MSKVILTAVAAVSIGANAYQFLRNRELTRLLDASGVKIEDQITLLKTALANAEGDVSKIKKELNDLIDDITSGELKAADVPERVMDIYRRASQPEPEAEAANTDPEAEGDAPEQAPEAKPE